MKTGRPTKMTKEFINILKEVAENSIYLTDEDLVFLVNEKLSEGSQIKIQTFKDYKSGKSQSDNSIYKEFSTLIKKALIKEKQELLKKVEKGDNGWQSKSWILERKFKEWNLKNISETENNTKIELINYDPFSKIRENSDIKE